MFVERLTREDIQEFLGNDYSLKTLNNGKDNHSDKAFIYVSISFMNSEQQTNHVLTDTMGIGEDTYWIMFLYKKFGEEYREWYLNRQSKMFDNMLKIIKSGKDNKCIICDIYK